MRRKPPTVNGAPRSDTNTNGDSGDSRLTRRNARSSMPADGPTLHRSCIDCSEFSRDRGRSRPNAIETAQRDGMTAKKLRDDAIAHIKNNPLWPAL
jgi:hypothetical protein